MGKIETITERNDTLDTIHRKMIRIRKRQQKQIANGGSSPLQIKFREYQIKKMRKKIEKGK